MTCIFCNTRPIDPEWDPYCGPECGVDAENSLIVLGDLPAFQTYKRRCWPKQRHATREEARDHLRRLVSLNMIGDKETALTYRCPHCGDFHVGHERRHA